MALSCWHGFGRSSFMKGSKFPQMFKFHYYFLQRNYASDSVMVMNHLLMLQRMLLNERTFIYFSNIQGFGSKRNVVEYIKICGPGSSVDIVTGYGLDVPGIESRRGRIFRACPDRSWGPPSLLYNRYRVFPRGKEQPWRDTDPSPPSSDVGHERVELYRYSSYGPYGLFF